MGPFWQNWGEKTVTAYTMNEHDWLKKRHIAGHSKASKISWRCRWTEKKEKTVATSKEKGEEKAKPGKGFQRH